MFANSLPLTIYAFIDYQAFFSGSPAYDLELIIFSLLRTDARGSRKEVEFDMLKFYYDELCKKINRTGRSAVGFTFQQLETAYLLCKVAGILKLLILNKLSETLIDKEFVTDSLVEAMQALWNSMPMSG